MQCWDMEGRNVLEAVHFAGLAWGDFFGMSV